MLPPLKLVFYMLRYQTGQVSGQFVKVCHVQESLAVDALDIGFVVADCGGEHGDAFVCILAFNSAQVSFGRCAVVAGAGGLSI